MASSGNGDDGRRFGFWLRLLPGRKAPPRISIEEIMANHRRDLLRNLYKFDASGMSLEAMQAKHRELLTPTGGEPTCEELLDWLKQQGPAEWHRSAATWNWDNPMDAMAWVLSQPDCDAGTAIMLFARGEPGYYNRFQTMEELEAKSG